MAHSSTFTLPVSERTTCVCCGTSEDLIYGEDCGPVCDSCKFESEIDALSEDRCACGSDRPVAVVRGRATCDACLTELRHAQAVA